VGKHRRHESAIVMAVQHYEQLVFALRGHWSGERSGLCVSCGVGWPCSEICRAVGSLLSPATDPGLAEFR
jgi:hypothetical protein